MPKLIAGPTRIAARGDRPKIIEEFFGCVNSDDDSVSIARMKSPEGWVEPGQRPEFTEFTVVLKGSLTIKHERGELEVAAGQGVVLSRRVGAIQQSSPRGRGVCRRVPARFFARYSAQGRRVTRLIAAAGQPKSKMLCLTG